MHVSESLAVSFGDNLYSKVFPKTDSLVTNALSVFAKGISYEL